jgi:hypothetical protein
VYREWGYTAWSRARERTRFYAVEPEISDEHHTAAPVDVDRFEELSRRLDRSEAQRLGLDALPEALADRRAAAGKHTSVTYLDRALGQRPDAIRDRRRWDRAARRIERYRSRHGITDSGDALGPQPAAPLERIAWRRTEHAIASYRSTADDRVARRGIGL